MTQTYSVERRFNGWALCACLFCAAIANAADPEVRTWVDATGENMLEATYVSHDAQKVTLKGADGQEFEIELEQLSKADREFVAKLPKKPGMKNQPRVLGGKAERGELLEVVPPEPPLGWSYTPASDSALPFAPAEFNIPLPEFGEDATGFVVTPSGRFAVLTTSFTQATRVSVVDLTKKKVVAMSATEGSYLAVAVSNDGQRVAIRSDEFDERNKIGVFQVSGRTLKLESDFVPFPDKPNTEILWADFVGDNQLAVLCEEAGISVWNLSEFKEDCYFELVGDAGATANADGSVIAFVDKEKVGLFQVSDRTFLGVQPVPTHLWSKQLGFSPSGQRLVSFAVNRIVAWDAATGAVTSDLPSIILPGSKLDCVQENYILLDNKYLVDLDNQLKLWTYKGRHESDSAGGTTFFAIKRGSGRSQVLAVVPVPLPDPEAQTALEQAMAKSDTFLLKPGGTVRLDVSQVPEEYREKVRASLEARAKANRFTVAKDAPSTIVASISGPQPVTGKYFSREDRTPRNFNFNIQVSKVEIMHDGKAIWSQELSNQPASVSAEKGKSIAEELTRLTAKPRLEFFEHVRLPQLIQKESKNEGPRTLWTLGESTVE